MELVGALRIILRWISIPWMDRSLPDKKTYRDSSIGGMTRRVVSGSGVGTLVSGHTLRTRNQYLARQLIFEAHLQVGIYKESGLLIGRVCSPNSLRYDQRLHLPALGPSAMTVFMLVSGQKSVMAV